VTFAPLVTWGVVVEHACLVVEDLEDHFVVDVV
jgi:hypothetical protein